MAEERSTPTIGTALTRLLGIKHPILLAPMGSAAGGALAAAVTHAGGLGLIGSGYADSAAIAKERAAAGNARIGIGFITWALNEKPAALDVALESKPAAIMLSFGDPAPHVAKIRAAGSRLICQVQSVAQARQAVDQGADILIAQGRDAGGHAGTTRGTMGLVPAIVDIAGRIPVVAAGGIADGRGLAAALALGAAGALIGTRFAASRESLWSEAMKARLIPAGGDDTEQTRVFDIVRDAPWPSQYPGRALRNAFSGAWHGREIALGAAQAEQEKTYLATPADDFAMRAVWAGEGVDLVKDIPTAGEIVEQLVADAIEVMGRSQALIGRG